MLPISGGRLNFKIFLVRLCLRNNLATRHLYFRNNHERSNEGECSEELKKSEDILDRLSSRNDIYRFTPSCVTISGSGLNNDLPSINNVKCHWQDLCESYFSKINNFKMNDDHRRHKMISSANAGGWRMFRVAMFEIYEQDRSQSQPNHGIDSSAPYFNTSQVRQYSTKSSGPLAGDIFCRPDEISSRKISASNENSNSVDKNQLSNSQSSNEVIVISSDSEVDDHVQEVDIETVKNIFSRPKEILHNFCTAVATEFRDPKYHASRSFRPVQSPKGNITKWKCTYYLHWPKDIQFTSEASKKSLAADVAALRALGWLLASNKITSKGSPKMYQKTEVENKLPVRLEIGQEDISAVRNLMEHYNEEIKPFLLEEIAEDAVSLDDPKTLSSFNEEDMEDTVSDITMNRVSSAEDLTFRNEQLLRTFRRRLKVSDELNEKYDKNALPIMKWRSVLCQMVRDNRVVIIKGEPGCGKSTQVPQFIIDEWTAKMRGAFCNIVVTQPRRISAISLAERVAYERDEQLGQTVGYQVRFRNVIPKSAGGTIIFCTTGTLLRRLQKSPGLDGCSHVILDEAHERDVNIDFLIVLLRRALNINDKLKVLVMSATLNAETFEHYFSEAKSLHVPGFTYPVTSYFLEDLRRKGLNLRVNNSDSVAPHIAAEDVANTTVWIDKNRPVGAILVFLPGWSEIVAVSKVLQDRMDNGTCYILPVHSRLPLHEQHKIFSTPPPGIRKIILATNIAESSLTINDVRYVVDCGLHKEERLDPESGLSTFGNRWISQANVTQRKGRAGRVAEGESYHLYTRDRLAEMDRFPIPEVLRVPLEKLVLDCKLFSEKEKAENFLSEMPEPPSREAICRAVDDLTELEALDQNENLTFLGKRIASFTTHPKLSKALVHATILKCLTPVLTVSTILTNNTDIFSCSLNEKEVTREHKKVFHPSSDHLALAWLFEQWNKGTKEEAEKCCSEFSLRRENLEITKKLRRIFVEHLFDSKMFRDANDKDVCESLDSDYNAYATNDELVKGVLISGWSNVLTKRSWDMKKGRITKTTQAVFTESGHRATISSDSVNFKKQNSTTPFFTHFQQTRSLESRLLIVRETSLISPLAVLLFKSGAVSTQKMSRGSFSDDVLLRIGDQVRMICSEGDVLPLLDLRYAISDILKYFIKKEGLAHDNEIYEKISCFRDQMLSVVGKILQQAGLVADSEKCQQDDSSDEDVVR